MKTIVIQIPDGKIAKWVNDTLILEDEQKKSYSIRTFKDALNRLGNNNPSVQEYYRLTINGAPSKETHAYLKLKIITEALNKESISYNNKFYVPVFNFFTDKDKMSEENIKEAVTVMNKDHGEIKVLIHAMYAFYLGESNHIGSSFFFNTRELAKYAATQFVDIWSDFLPFFHK